MAATIIPLHDPYMEIARFFRYDHLISVEEKLLKVQQQVCERSFAAQTDEFGEISLLFTNLRLLIRASHTIRNSIRHGGKESYFEND